jgi:hypothetical protein
MREIFGRQCRHALPGKDTKETRTSNSSSNNGSIFLFVQTQSQTKQTLTWLGAIKSPHKRVLHVPALRLFGSSALRLFDSSSLPSLAPSKHRRLRPICAQLTPTTTSVAISTGTTSSSATMPNHNREGGALSVDKARG